MSSVSEQDRLSSAPLSSSHLGIRLHDRVRNSGYTGGPREIASVHPVPHHDQVVRKRLDVLSSRQVRLFSPSLREPPGKGEPECGIGQRRGAGDKEWGHGHGHDGNREEELIVVPREKTVFQPHTGQDEGELSYLAESQTAQKGRSQREAKNNSHCSRDTGLCANNQDCRGYDQQRCFEEERNIEEHPDRHEEEADEQVLEGDDLPKGLSTVLRLRDHEPREKSTEGQGQARPGSEPGGGESHCQGHEEEDLATLGPGSLEENPGHYPASGEHHEHYDCDPFPHQSHQGPG